MKRWILLRVKRLCHACERPMEKGEKALYWCGQPPDEGHRLVNGHWCPVCAPKCEEINKAGETVFSGHFLKERLEQERAEL